MRRTTARVLPVNRHGEAGDLFCDELPRLTRQALAAVGP
jgi:hypothetical protein